MNDKIPLRKARINSLVLGIAILISIGFFFYGMVNNIVAKKDKQLALEETIKRVACEEHSISLVRQLQEKEIQLTQAQTEAALLIGQTSLKRKK